MNKTKWIIFVLVTFGFLTYLAIFAKSSSLDVSKIDANIVQVANDQNGGIADHVTGKIGSKLTLIEYGDYQCPGCGSINPTIESVVDHYKDQIQFIFRNFTLTNIHPNAKAAAAAVEAAGMQDKYWEMHKKIYAGSSDWSNLIGTKRSDFFVKYAKELGLDTSKFSTDIALKSISDKINYDYAIGQKSGVDSTPHFFLNGKKIDPKIWSDETKFKEFIDSELAKIDTKKSE